MSVEGGALTNLNVTAPVVNNSIIWLNGTSAGANNSSFTNDGSSGVTGASNIIQGTPGVSDPLFVNAAGDNYRLASLSPAINAGDNSLYGSALNMNIDLDGKARLTASAIDIGAYETALSSTIYVDSSGNDANNGDSWAKPFRTLSYALTLANANALVKNILIGKGHYYPAGTPDATAANGDSSFIISRNGIRLYGGYDAATGLRNIAANKVYLTGNNSSFHVLVIANISLGDSVIVDGVTIQNANCNGNTLHTYNGVGFNGNEGGGVSAVGNNWLGNALMFRNCAFINNNGNNHAAAFYNNESSPSFVSCLFANNTAPNDGSAIFNWSNSKPVFTNCTIAYNITANSGGTIANAGTCLPVFNNCIMWLNGTSAGLNNSGISNDAGSSITANNSIMQGTANAIDPLFINAATGNYRLSYASRAVNAGSNALYVGDLNNDNDIDGKPRLTGYSLDMGAYEVASAPSTLYVDAVAGNDANDGSAWAKAFKTLSTALNAVNTNTTGYKILIAKGTYYPGGDAATTTSNKDTAFAILHNGIRLYGGYDANTGQRNAAVNKTYLDGNNSSYHIMAIAGIGTGDSVIVDGLTIQNARALGTGPLHVYNGIGFNSNEGGGVAVKGCNALGNQLLFRYCTFINNTSDNNGGAFYNAETSPEFINCLFANNTATNSGGAMFNYDGSNPVFINSTIANNVSANGGAIYNYGNCIPVINNSIVWLNGTGSGLNDNGIAANSLPVANGASSIIQGGVAGNSTADPLLVNASGGNYGLLAASPAINAGSNALYYGDINNDVDLAGKARLVAATIDMGAYEASAYTATWTGATNTDWNTKGNWNTNIVPTASVDVIIPSAPVNQPTVNADATAHSITLDGKLTVTNATLGISGDVTSSGTFDAGSGSITYNGTALQTIAGTITAGNLTINNTAGVTLYSGATKVYGTYTPQAGTLNANGKLVLASTATGTANVAAGTGNYINGTVTVERYIPNVLPGTATPHRAWRLLTAPLSQTGTIYNNWQNVGVADDSTGAVIFKPKANGTDGYTAGGHEASMEYYDEVSDNWADVPNTNATSLGNNNTAAANQAYAIFVTGPYGADASIKGTAQPTTLRASGLLQTGNQTFIYTPGNGHYMLTGNPYASPVDLAAVVNNSTGIQKQFWLWDPNRAGTSVGGYVTFTNIGGTYISDVAGQTMQTTVLQSGQAFMTQANTTGTVSVPFTEANKTDASTGINGVFFGPSPATSSLLRVVLNRKLNDTITPVDGVLAVYDNSYKKDAADDADKLYNYDENLSIRIDTNYVAIQKTPLPQKGDSLWLDVAAMKAKSNYSFTFKPQNIPANIQAWIVDRFLNTKTPVDLAAQTDVTFTTTSDQGSYDETRFVVVFASQGALASTLTHITAWQQDKVNQVQWTTATEQGIQQYIVERSSDGQSFKQIGVAVTPRNTGKTEVYGMTDKEPVVGDNYYRIQIINKDAAPAYSNVVMVKVLKGKPAFTVSPNPVQKSQQLQVTYTNMDAGRYALLLYSSDGKKVLQRSITLDGSAATQTISLPLSLAAATYRLVLADEKGHTWAQVIVID
ncbi:MAG: hypothetical protein JSR37_08790 [Verrucomicrobia bacterium]|nr:hypothetical protein [Verrucomicrobiota bacterium]